MSPYFWRRWRAVGRMRDEWAAGGDWIIESGYCLDSVVDDTREAE